MDTIKKKMLAIQFERDNALKKTIIFQQKLKEKEKEKLKQEETMNELLKTLQADQQECDKIQDSVSEVFNKLSITEKLAANSEDELAALMRRYVLLQADLEQAEFRFQEMSEKLEKARILQEINEKAHKEFEIKSILQDEKLNHLEQTVKEAKIIAEDAMEKNEEVCRKSAILEYDLNRTEERLEICELKTVTLEEELDNIGRTLKSLELSEQETMLREESYEDTIKDLTERLKLSEKRAVEAERCVSKLQSEIDRLDDELLFQMEKYKNLNDELDLVFSELTKS